MKMCGKCRVTKPLSDFSRRGTGHQSYCKGCATTRKREWIAGNRDRVRWNSLWSRFRLRPEDWESLWDKQGGLCAVCRAVPPAHVDHDHACCPGRNSCGHCVRGLLCAHCNMIVGCVETRPNLLELVHLYLAPIV